MTLFKKHPRLFTNGKFNAQIRWGNGEISPYIIDGYFLDYDGEGESLSLGAHCMPLSHCTLIARPISDMSFMELKKAPIHNGWDATELTMKESLIYRANTGTITLEDSMYLLSLGVYPGHQKDFISGKILVYRETEPEQKIEEE